jgi:hypothetical protein
MRSMQRVAWALLLLLTGCQSAAPDAGTVTAVVEKIEPHGYQDFITDGSVVSWTLVTFTVVEPRRERGTLVHAYCAGQPLLEDAPLLVGQSVKFALPPPARREALPLEELGARR